MGVLYILDWWGDDRYAVAYIPRGSLPILRHLGEGLELTESLWLVPGTLDTEES